MNERPTGNNAGARQQRSFNTVSYPVEGGMHTAPVRREDPVSMDTPKPSTVSSSEMLSRKGQPVGEKEPMTRQTASGRINSEVRSAMDVTPIPESNGFIKMLHEMVDDFADIDEITLHRNIDIIVRGKFPFEERTIKFEVAQYMISNLGYIIMGMVLDAEFKKQFYDAVRVETMIDLKNDEDKKRIRNMMKDPNPYKSIGSMTIGLSIFTEAVMAKFNTAMQQSFNELLPFEKEFDDKVAQLTPAQRVEYGFIFGNFAYLLRVICMNETFVSYVVNITEHVKASLGVNKK